MPHIIPCPAPRVDFADSDNWEYSEDGTGRRRRRRRRRERRIQEQEAEVAGGGSGADAGTEGVGEREEMAARRKKAHECPVPKPGGVIGEVLGFRKTGGDERIAGERTRRIDGGEE